MLAGSFIGLNSAKYENGILKNEDSQNYINTYKYNRKCLTISRGELAWLRKSFSMSNDFFINKQNKEPPFCR